MILDICTQFLKAHRNFPDPHFSSCHPPGVRREFIREIFCWEYHPIQNRPYRARDYPNSLVERITSEVKFRERKSALQQRETVQIKILPFVTKYHPAMPNFKNILMSKRHLIKNQPLLRETYKYISTSIRAVFGMSTFYSILRIGACSFLLTAG